MLGVDPTLYFFHRNRLLALIEDRIDVAADETCDGLPALSNVEAEMSRHERRGLIEINFKFAEIMLEESIIQNLTEQYLRFIHDRPHSLFHANTLRRDMLSPSFNRLLKLCVCVMGARFALDVSVRQLAGSLAAQARMMLDARVYEPCIENVQALVLLANVCAAESLVSHEAMYFGAVVLASNRPAN